MKKNNLVILILLFMFSPLVVSAKNDYEVKSYEIEITSKKNEYTYNENIELNFEKENILVTKELPKSIENLEVNVEHIITNPYNKVIEITNKDTNPKIYNYKYKNTINNSKDIYEFAINNTFNNDLNNITFIINMESDFNKENLEFYVNNKKVKNIDYKIKDKQLFGSYNSLKEGESLVVKINYGKLYLSNITIISIVIPIIFSIISVILWFIYGKDLNIQPEKVSKFSSKLNPLDISLINKGKVDYDDSFYLLMSLANRGYIKIIENANNDYTLIRDKDYDGKRYVEALFIKTLFRKSESISLADYINVLSERKPKRSPRKLESEITNEDLYKKYISASKQTTSVMNSQEEKGKYFEDKPERIKICLVFAIAIILVLVTALPFIEINNFLYLPISLTFSIMSLYLLIKFVDSIDLNKKSSKITILILLAIIVLLIILIPTIQRNRIYLITYFISCSSVAFILFLYKYMPKRTLYGSREYSKIEGFKLFVNDMSKKELDPIIELNENYLYDILPYSYMFGLSDRVLKYLREYKVSKPTWFILKDNFTIKKLDNSIQKLKECLEYNEEKDLY